MNLSAITSRLPLDELQQAREEWDSNPRLRLGLLAIWGLLLVYLVLVLSDAAAGARQDLVQVNKRLDRLQAIHAQQYWLDRAERSKVALRELQDTFPVVPSSGRAEAQVRAMLEEAIRESGSRKLRLQMETAQSVRDGEMWRVGATVSGVVDGNTARDVLATMETRANYGRVQRLKLVRGLTPEKVRVEVEMEYLFRAAGE